VDTPAQTIPSARFCLDGITLEVEPCADDVGTWRAREVEPSGKRGQWERGRYAWQAMEAVTGKKFTAA
jgi:hypothetical protein